MDVVSSLRPAAPAKTLAAARVGDRLRVTSVDDAEASELTREGLLPGAILVVASRTPLGGPVIVTLGRVRLALSAHVADAVRVEPAP
jgi:Fe2+ transport system protein FeoA